MEIARVKSILIVVATGALATGCSEDGGGGDGNLRVLLEPEETIVEGLEAGPPGCEECITDGYSVTFSKYIVAVGFVAMSQAGDANPQESSVVGVADFKTIDSALPQLTAFNGIPTGQYTSFGYETPAPDATVININSVDQADVDELVQNGWSYIIEGTVTRESDGETVDFLVEAKAPAVYTDCALETLPEPGVNVSTNSDVPITLHGDHLFFNGFPEDENNVTRLAQWMWTVGEQQDTDGTITREDFEAAENVEELFPTPTYELDASPVRPILTAWDFVRAQLGTQGHIYGNGECEWGEFGE